jgi:hypothetical protein
MIDEKKTADELLFEEPKEEVVFRSMVIEGALLNDIVQKDKI